MTAGSLLALALAVLAAPPEGATVASVRIDGDRRVAARLEALLDVRPGEPLRAVSVRRTVERLHATGAFEDVIVEASSSAAGVDLLIRLVPAPLLGGVRVAGDRVLSAGEIRRTARLEPREPLWTQRLDRAARDVAIHLSRDGYLESRVTAEAVPSTGAADALFTVHAGPRARLSKVVLAGPERLEAERLRPFVGLAPGEVYRRGEAEEAAERLRQRLASWSRWRARATVREAYDPSTAGVAVTLEVEPGPPTAVEFDAPRLPGRLRGRLAALLRDGRLQGDVLEEVNDRLEDEYRRRGHREAAVTHREEPGPRRLVVRYEVRAGPQAQVASVSLQGARPALEGLLRTRAGDPVQDRILEQDVRALTRAVEDEGHPGVAVEVEVPEGGGLVPVVFTVRAGPRTQVRQVVVECPVALEEGRPELRLRPGRPYRVRDLAGDRADLLAALRNAGYLQAEVVPEVVFSEDRTEATVRLGASPGPRTMVDRVVLAGLERTRPRVVERELLVREGAPLGLQQVLESQKRLTALGIFERVAIAEMDPESIETRSLVVRVEEAPSTTVSYGIGYAERDFLRASAEVVRRNLSGLDRSLTTFVRASFRGNRVLATYREPYLFGGRQELFVTGFREEEERDSFSFVRYGGLLQTARGLGKRWNLIVRYTFQRTSVFDIAVPLDDVDRQFRNTTSSGPSVSVVNDSRDDPLDPRRGHFLGADVQLSHEELGGDSFMKGFLQASHYRRIEPRLTVALGGRLGLGGTFGVGVPRRLPLPDRFFAGGPYSLRGFELDTAGPLELSTDGALVPTGGNALVLGGAELRVEVGRFLSLAAFGEAGSAYRLISDVSLDGLRFTAGLGLRYRSALGPLRLDWGYKLDRRPDEPASDFHFTLGHAF